MSRTIKSKYEIHIPTKDVISWLFDEPTHDVDAPVFINYDSPSEVFTTKSLITAVRRINRGVRELANVRKGDVVLLCGGNTIWYTPLLLGIIAAGAIFTGANPAYLETELTHQLSNSGAKAIFTSPEKLELTLKCAAKLGIPQSQVFLFTPEHSKGGIKTLGDVLNVGEGDWERLTTLQDVKETTAVLTYSSGTSTGLPKGCQITHYNMIANAAGAIHHRARGDEARRARGVTVYPDVCLGFLPLFHISKFVSEIVNGRGRLISRPVGQNTFCVINVKAGRLTYIMAAYSLPKFLEAIEKHRITFLLIAPPIVAQLVKSPLTKKYNLSSLKNIFSGGAALSKDYATEAERLIDSSGELRMTQAFGMTETAGTTTLFGGEVIEPDKSAIGHLIPNFEARLVDEAESDVLWHEDTNAEGELWLRGPSVFKGYWRNDAATREVLTKDGWFKTGDVAKVDRDGALFLVDRKKEMIKVKGFSVAPTEVEATLLQHPDVADAAVVGITRDEQEHPRAYVVLKPTHGEVTPSDIAAFIASRLAQYKQLTGGVVFVEAIPRNPSGKLLRRIIKERAQAELKGEKTKAQL
ncbi:acetyl-CoA synthetase-like protein [Ramaria rubella]|nr:acetyl-CoA synthetase-like protein [Ramaria rubella]